MLTAKKQKNLRESLNDKVTVKSANYEKESPNLIAQKDCKHLKVRRRKCLKCQHEVPHYGSVLDTGTIKTFIKVVFIDESKKQGKDAIASLMRQQDEESHESESQIVSPMLPKTIDEQLIKEEEQEGNANKTEDGNFSTQVQRVTICAPQSSQAIQDAYTDKVPVVRDMRQGLQNYQPMVSFRTIYESYNPENTHLMREYMLHVIIRNVRQMYKNKLISKATFKKFHLLPSLEPPKLQSNELRQFLSQYKRDMRTLDPEYLQFDSTIESGNLERAEAQPISLKYIEQQRKSRQPVIQKYNLFCKVDTNTKGHQQWFYFKCKNTKLDTKYQISICNFTKPFSLFKQGMQIQMLSKKHQQAHIKALEAEIAKYEEAVADEYSQSHEPLSPEAKLYRSHGIVTEQWQAVGTKIEYVKSKLERAGWNVPGPLNIDDEEEPNVEQDDLNVQLGEGGVEVKQQNSPQQDGGQNFRKRYFYQMNFEIEFPYENDTVYLAYSRPYQYTKIIANMFEIESRLSALPRYKQQNLNHDIKKGFRRKILRNSIVYERSLLCTTICGLPVPRITITANKSHLNHQVNPMRRKVIFVTARVHPGETSASTVFEGFLNSLIEQCEYSPVLANYIVHMVPCMNPDGVVCGNYRSSLAGVDLNRQWILPSKELHPEVYYTKSLMQHITKVENKKILIYCDIHCHSKKKNSFLYGCNTAAEGAPFSTWTQVRLLPRLLAKRSEYISLPSCRFGVEQCKLGTARVVVWKEFRVMNSFTLENSFYGYDYGSETRVYTQDNYREIGAGLEKTLNDYRVCLAQIQAELIDTKGWLKPNKLKQITGIPAAEVIANEMKEEKIRKKKEEYIRKYTSRMAREGGKGYSFAPASSTNNLHNTQIDSLRQSAPNPMKQRPTNSTNNFAIQLQKSDDPSFRKQHSTLRQKQSKIKVTDSAQKNNQPPNEPSQFSQSHDLTESENAGNKMVSMASEENIKTSSAKNSKKREIRKLVSQDFQNSNNPSMINPMASNHFQNTRDSTQTLLANQNEVVSSYNQLGAKSSSMLINSNYQLPQNLRRKDRAGSNSSKSERNQLNIEESDRGATVPWDNNQFDQNIGSEDIGALTSTKVENWRQLFGEEELKRAYQLSIIVSNQEARESPDIQVADAALLQNNDQSVYQIADNDMIDIQIKKENDQQEMCSNDDSGGSASEDDLKEVELFAKVYMKKKKSITKLMRQTMRAQNNFIQEVKIMVKQKDLEFGFKPRKKVEKKESRSLHKSMQSLTKPQRDPMEHYKPPLTVGGINHNGLKLTGVQIENPNKDAFKTPQVAKEFIVRRSSPAKKVDPQNQTRFRKSKKRDDLKPVEFKQEQSQIDFQNRSLQEAFSTTKIELEEGKKTLKIPSKFQHQKNHKSSIPNYDLNHLESEQSPSDRQNLIGMISQDLLMVGSRELQTGSQEDLGSLNSILTSSRVQLQKFDSKKETFSTTQAQSIDDEGYQIKVASSRYNVRKHLLNGEKQVDLPETILSDDSQVQVRSIDRKEQARKQQQLLQAQNYADSPKPLPRIDAPLSSKRQHKEYTLQVQDPQNPDQKIIGFKIDHFQKLQGAESPKNIEQSSGANPFKLEMVKKKDVKDKVQLGISSFKIQTPGTKQPSNRGSSAKKVSSKVAAAKRIGVGRSIPHQSMQVGGHLEAIREAKEVQFRSSRSKISSQRQAENNESEQPGAAVSTKEYIRQRASDTASNQSTNLISRLNPISGGESVPHIKQVKESYEDQDSQQQLDSSATKSLHVSSERKLVQRKLINHNRRVSQRKEHRLQDAKINDRRKSNKQQQINAATNVTATSQDSVLDGLERRIAQTKVQFANQQQMTVNLLDRDQNATNVDIMKKAKDTQDSQHVSDHFQTVQIHDKRKANITTVPEMSKVDGSCTEYMRSQSNFGDNECIVNTMNSVLQSTEKINSSQESIYQSQSQISQHELLPAVSSSASKERVIIKSLINVHNDQAIQSNHIPKKLAARQLQNNAAKIGKVQIHSRGDTGAKKYQQHHPHQKRRLITDNKQPPAIAGGEESQPDKLDSQDSYQMRHQQQSSSHQHSNSNSGQQRMHSDGVLATREEVGELEKSLFPPELLGQNYNPAKRSLFSQFMDDSGDKNQDTLRIVKRQIPANSDGSGAAAPQQKHLHNLSMPNIGAGTAAHQQHLPQPSDVQPWPMAASSIAADEKNSGSNQMLSRRRSEQFQMYIQMNMHNMPSQALKETYARQLQANQAKRTTAANPAAGLGKGGIKTLRTVSSDVSDPTVSIGESQPGSGSKIYSGTSPQQFGQKRRLSSGAHQLKAARLLQQQNQNHHLLTNRRQKIQHAGGSQGHPHSDAPPLVSGLNLMMTKGASGEGELVRAPMNSVNDLKKLENAGLARGGDSLASLRKSKNNKASQESSFDRRTSNDYALVKQAQAQLLQDGSFGAGGPTRQAVASMQFENGALPLISRTIDESLSFRQSSVTDDSSMRVIFQRERNSMRGSQILESDGAGAQDDPLLHQPSLTSVTNLQIPNSGSGQAAISSSVSPARSLNPGKMATLPRKQQGFAEHLREREQLQAQQLQKPIFQKNRNKKESGARLKLKQLLQEDYHPMMPNSQGNNNTDQQQAPNSAVNLRKTKLMPQTTSHSGHNQSQVSVASKNQSIDTSNKLPLLPLVDKNATRKNEDISMTMGGLSNTHHRMLSQVASKKQFPASNLTSQRISQEHSPTMNQVILNLRRSHQNQ